MVMGDGPPLSPPAPRPDERVAVALLMVGGVTPNGICPPAPLVLVVEEVLPRETLMVLTGCTVTPLIEISTPRVFSTLIPSGLVANPDLKSTILEIKEIELVLKKSTSQPRD
jgi:hypothetical protein